MTISESINQKKETLNTIHTPRPKEIHVVFDETKREQSISTTVNHLSTERRIEITNPDSYPKNIYIEPDIIQKAIKEWGMGISMELPRNVFHGTQPMEDYNQATRRYVEKQLQTYGKAYLKENPIIVIAIPTLLDGHEGTRESLILAIGDGHHRFRYSGGRKEFEYVPAIVFTPLQYSVLYNIGKDNQDKITPDELEIALMQRIAEAKLSFEGSLANKGKTNPAPLYGISTIEELRTLLDTSINAA